MKLKIGDIIGYKPPAYTSLTARVVKSVSNFTHVTKYLGNNKILHAAPGDGGVRIEAFNREHFEKHPEWYAVLRNDQILSKLDVAWHTALAKKHADAGYKYSFYQGGIAFLYKYLLRVKWVRKLIAFLKQVDEKYFRHCSEEISRFEMEFNGHDLSPETHDFTLPDDIMYTKAKWYSYIEGVDL